MNTTITDITNISDMVAQGILREHHTATHRGYISRREPQKVTPYEGRFGKGYCVVSPRWDTSQYVYVTYYVYVTE